jgi:hypothetical protein
VGVASNGTCLAPLCALARLERGGAGHGIDEAGGALGAGCRQRCQDLPGPSAFWSFVTTRDFACDYCRTQLAFGQVVSGINSVVIQKGKEMVALFCQAVADGFMMMSVALLLQGCCVIVNSQTVTDQHPGKVGTQQFSNDGTSPALIDQIKGALEN